MNESGTRNIWDLLNKNSTDAVTTPQYGAVDVKKEIDPDGSCSSQGQNGRRPTEVEDRRINVKKKKSLQGCKVKTTKCETTPMRPTKESGQKNLFLGLDKLKSKLKSNAVEVKQEVLEPDACSTTQGLEMGVYQGECMTPQRRSNIFEMVPTFLDQTVSPLKDTEKPAMDTMLKSIFKSEEVPLLSFKKLPFSKTTRNIEGISTSAAVDSSLDKIGCFDKTLVIKQEVNDVTSSLDAGGTSLQSKSKKGKGRSTKSKKAVSKVSATEAKNNTGTTRNGNMYTNKSNTLSIKITKQSGTNIEKTSDNTDNERNINLPTKQNVYDMRKARPFLKREKEDISYGDCCPDLSVRNGESLFQKVDVKNDDKESCTEESEIKNTDNTNFGHSSRFGKTYSKTSQDFKKSPIIQDKSELNCMILEEKSLQLIPIKKRQQNLLSSKYNNQKTTSVIERTKDTTRNEEINSVNPVSNIDGSAGQRKKLEMPDCQKDIKSSDGPLDLSLRKDIVLFGKVESMSSSHLNDQKISPVRPFLQERVRRVSSDREGLFNIFQSETKVPDGSRNSSLKTVTKVQTPFFDKNSQESALDDHQHFDKSKKVTSQVSSTNIPKIPASHSISKNMSVITKSNEPNSIVASTSRAINLGPSNKEIGLKKMAEVRPNNAAVLTLPPTSEVVNARKSDEEVYSFRNKVQLVPQQGIVCVEPNKAENFGELNDINPCVASYSLEQVTDFNYWSSVKISRPYIYEVKLLSKKVLSSDETYKNLIKTNICDNLVSSESENTIGKAVAVPETDTTVPLQNHSYMPDKLIKQLEAVAGNDIDTTTVPLQRDTCIPDKTIKQLNTDVVLDTDTKTVVLQSDTFIPDKPIKQVEAVAVPDTDKNVLLQIDTCVQDNTIVQLKVEVSSDKASGTNLLNPELGKSFNEVHSEVVKTSPTTEPVVDIIDVDDPDVSIVAVSSGKRDEFHECSHNKSVSKEPVALRRSSRPVKPTAKILEQMQLQDFGFEEFLNTGITDKSLSSPKSPKKYKHCERRTSVEIVGTSPSKMAVDIDKKELSTECHSPIKTEENIDSTDNVFCGKNSIKISPNLNGKTKTTKKRGSKVEVAQPDEDCLFFSQQYSNQELSDEDNWKCMKSDSNESPNKSNFQSEEHKTGAFCDDSKTSTRTSNFLHNDDNSQIRKIFQKNKSDEQSSESDVVIIDDSPPPAVHCGVKKLPTDPAAFEPIAELSKNVMEKKEQFFSVYKVPLKTRKKFKRFRLWKKRSVCFSQLFHSENTVNPVRYSHPVDTEIRVKELKLGQSWKEHFFHHKTERLKIPLQLVSIPKSEPPNLNFNVPKEFIILKDTELQNIYKPGHQCFKRSVSIDKIDRKDLMTSEHDSNASKLVFKTKKGRKSPALSSLKKVPANEKNEPVLTPKKGKKFVSPVLMKPELLSADPINKRTKRNRIIQNTISTNIKQTHTESIKIKDITIQHNQKIVSEKLAMMTGVSQLPIVVNISSPANSSPVKSPVSAKSDILAPNESINLQLKHTETVNVMSQEKAKQKRKYKKDAQSSLPIVQNYASVNKDITNVIEFAKILRKSEEILNTDVIPQETDSVEPVVSMDTTKKDIVLTRHGKKTNMLKPTQKDILKHKVIRRLTGQVPVMPACLKPVSPRKIAIPNNVPISIINKDSNVGVPFVLPNNPSALAIPGLKTYSVEMVEVQQLEASDGGNVVVMSSLPNGSQALKDPTVLKKHLCVPISCTTTSQLPVSGNVGMPVPVAACNSYTGIVPKVIEQFSPLKNSVPMLQMPNNSVTVSQPINHKHLSPELTLTVTKGAKTLNCLNEWDESPTNIALKGNSKIEPIVIEEDNGDADSTLSYEDLSEKLNATLFEDLIDDSQNPLVIDAVTTDTANEDVDTTDLMLHNGYEEFIDGIYDEKNKCNTPEKEVSDVGDSPAKRTRSSKRKVISSINSPKEANPKDFNKKTKPDSSSSKSAGNSVSTGKITFPIKTENEEKIPLRRASTSEERKKNICKRTLLDELKSSDGFIADKQPKASDNLFLDPSKLSREERALQRAIMAFSEMELKKALRHQREKDHVQKKANQIKKKAVQHSKKKDKAQDRKGFQDFQPEILEKRTRFEWFNPGFGSNNYGQKSSVKFKSCSSKEPIVSPLKFTNFENLSDSGSTKSRKRKQETNINSTPKGSSDTHSAPKKLNLQSNLLSIKKKGTMSCKLSVIKTEVISSDEESLPDLDPVPQVHHKTSNLKKIKGKSASRKITQKIKSYVREEPPLSFMDSLMGNMKPLVYIDRADIPSPCVTPLPQCDMIEDQDNSDLLNDHFDTMSVSTTMSLDGGRVKIPHEVRKISVNRDSGESVLHKAARLGYRDVVLWCCQTGYADPKGKDYAGFVPLHEACAAGQIEIAKILLAYGADINVASKKDGVRPLHDAIESDHIEMVRLVLSCGGDPNLDTYGGKNIFQMIRSKEMKAFLGDYKMDVTGSVRNENRTPWRFRDFLIEGEEDSDDEEELGQNIMDNVPPDIDDESNSVTDPEEMMFECSDHITIPLYNITVDAEEGPHNYALLLDILQTLGMTKLDFTQQMNSRVVSISWEEFVGSLQRKQISVNCKWLPDSGRKRKFPVDLVKWNSKFQELFDVEEVTIRLDKTNQENSSDKTTSNRYVSASPHSLSFTPPSHPSSLQKGKLIENDDQSFYDFPSMSSRKVLNFSHLSAYLNSTSDSSCDSFENQNNGKEIPEKNNQHDWSRIRGGNIYDDKRNDKKHSISSTVTVESSHSSGDVYLQSDIVKSGKEKPTLNDFSSGSISSIHTMNYSSPTASQTVTSDTGVFKSTTELNVSNRPRCMTSLSSKNNNSVDKNQNWDAFNLEDPANPGSPSVVSHPGQKFGTNQTSCFPPLDLFPNDGSDKKSSLWPAEGYQKGESSSVGLEFRGPIPSNKMSTKQHSVPYCMPTVLLSENSPLTIGPMRQMSDTLHGPVIHTGNAPLLYPEQPSIPSNRIKIEPEETASADVIKPVFTVSNSVYAQNALLSPPVLEPYNSVVTHPCTADYPSMSLESHHHQAQSYYQPVNPSQHPMYPPHHQHPLHHQPHLQSTENSDCGLRIGEVLSLNNASASGVFGTGTHFSSQK